jgi:hypothetical protein
VSVLDQVLYNKNIVLVRLLLLPLTGVGKKTTETRPHSLPEFQAHLHHPNSPEFVTWDSLFLVLLEKA